MRYGLKELFRELPVAGISLFSFKDLLTWREEATYLAHQSHVDIRCELLKINVKLLKCKMNK